LATSVWLPWVFGVLALLSIASASVLVGGRVAAGVAVPPTVLDLQQAAAVTVAQQVRGTLQAGLQDLEQLTGTLATLTDPTALDAAIKAFGKRYQRYRSVYVIDESAKVIAAAGAVPHPAQVPPAPKQAAMTDALDIEHLAVVVQFAPFTLASGGKAVAVAEYDLARLKFVFQTVSPSSAWLVNAKGQVVASTEGFVAFGQLPRGQLKEPAATAVDKAGVSVHRGDIDAGEIVAYAPVRGTEKSTGVPKWGLVTARGVNTVVLPQTQARDQALLLGLALTVVTVGVFAWMYVMWLRPLRHLLADARRVAAGDLAKPVEIRRHDELGQIAVAVERIRVKLGQQGER
jgi:HAMP domain-containing protein